MDERKINRIAFVFAFLLAILFVLVTRDISFEREARSVYMLKKPENQSKWYIGLVSKGYTKIDQQLMFVISEDSSNIKKIFEQITVPDNDSSLLLHKFLMKEKLKKYNDSLGVVTAGEWKESIIKFLLEFEDNKPKWIRKFGYKDSVYLSRYKFKVKENLLYFRGQRIDLPNNTYAVVCNSFPLLRNHHVKILGDDIDKSFLIDSNKVKFRQEILDSRWIF